MKKYKVKCANCFEYYHETTEEFDESGPYHGAMFALIEPYRSWRWEAFPEYKDTVYGELRCPNCRFPYLDDAGNLDTRQLIDTGETFPDPELHIEIEFEADFVIPEVVKDTLTCGHCGLECKSRAGLSAHLRAKHA